MGLAMALQEYLSDRGVTYEVMPHKHTHTSTQTARASHVPEERLAKAVVLTREGGFVMAIVPASCKVRLDSIEELYHCPITLASEAEIDSLFPDCEVGAIPPVGEAYAVDCVVDESLPHEGDIYLEAGDHRNLLRLGNEQFQALMKDVPHAHIAVRA